MYLRPLIGFLAFCVGLSFPQSSIAQDIAPDHHHFMVNNSPLTSDELTQAFSGQIHKGFYRFEREALPTHRFEETTFADGRVEHVQGDEVLKGLWRVKDNRICYRYEDIWTRELCFDMYRVGNCYYHYIRTSGGLPTSGWTARSSIKEDTPSCEAQIS